MHYPKEKHCQKSLGHFIKILCYILSNAGYSLSPDLANAATLSVSLIEGNMKETQSISGEMVLERQDLEIFDRIIVVDSFTTLEIVNVTFFGSTIVEIFVINRFHFFSESNRHNILNNLRSVESLKSTSLLL